MRVLGFCVIPSDSRSPRNRDVPQNGGLQYRLVLGGVEDFGGHGSGFKLFWGVIQGFGLQGVSGFP